MIISRPTAAGAVVNRFVRPTRVCKQCGCTETTPCTDPNTGLGCHWVKPNLCNVCAEKI